jgi:hypothetical protein
MRDDVLTRARQALERKPAPSPDLGPVQRRARTLRARRAVAVGAVAALVALGTLGPLAALWHLGGSRGRPADETPAPSQTAPVLDFEEAPGWHVLTTDPSLAGSVGVQAWASNVPFVEGDEPVGPVNSLPEGWPGETEDALPPDGIIIVAAYAIETRNPLSPNESFPERTLPLTIEQRPSVQYEGQDPDRALAIVNASVNGRYVNVRIVFGTRDPSADLVREANEELGELIVAPQPVSTTSIDDFGLRMDLPDEWHGILFSFWSALPVLHAATVPVVDVYDGTSARQALGPDDLFLVLSQNDAFAARYEPVSLPIEIRSEDICPTCEILDNGTSPPPGHTLFYRSFAVERRQFDLFVEFGTPSPTAEQVAHLNGVLATLQIDPPETPPIAVESPAPVPQAPVSIDLPPGWIEKDDPVPGTTGPRVVTAYGTWDFPTGGSCGPEPALAELPTDGALVWLVEHANPGNAGDFISLMPQFSIDLQGPPARWECAAAAPSRMYLFRVGGRFFEVHVALGWGATAATVEQASGLITSLQAEPPG